MSDEPEKNHDIKGIIDIRHHLRIIPTILASGGAKSRSSLHRSLYSISPSPSSSSKMFEALTIEDDRKLVRLLPLELLSSDIGDMQEDLPDMDEMPESEWEWLCVGLGVSPSFQFSPVGGVGPPSKLLFHQLDIDFKERSLLKCKDCCFSSGDVRTLPSVSFCWNPG